MNKKILVLTIIIVSFLTSAYGQVNNSTYYVSANNLNLRSQSNLNSKVITRLSKGTKVVLKSVSNSWANITVNDTLKGYVLMRYLSLTIPEKKQKKQATVFICNSKNAYAYHSHRCHGLNRCRSGVSSVTKSKAENSGYRACKICY